MSQSISQCLADFIGMQSGAAFARGSTGLYGLLVALRKINGVGEVIIPALCCESVALAAVYAGHQVRFADVSQDTLGVTKDTVAALMTDNTRAVIVAHLFGIDAEVDQFSQLRTEYPGTVFIEDVAHAIGARNKIGNPLGGQLDCALLSFSDNKILPGDGGVLLLAESCPVSIESAIENIPTDAPGLPQPHKSLSLRNLVHALADLWRVEPGVDAAAIFSPALKYYRDIIVCSGGIADIGILEMAIDEIETTRAARVYRHNQYREKLNAAFVYPISIDGNSWRCPILISEPSRCRIVTARLRSGGINASNHYFPLNILFGVDACPSAEDISSRIINLWVDDSASERQIEKAAKIINAI